MSYVDSLYGTALRLTGAGRCGGSGPGHVLEGVSLGRQFQRGTNLKAWLFTILHNTFRNMRRHDGRNPVDVDSEYGGAGAGAGRQEQSPEEILTRATLDVDLQAALDALPDAFRQAVWLRDVEEFTYAEIARGARRADRHRDVADLARTAQRCTSGCRPDACERQHERPSAERKQKADVV